MNTYSPSKINCFDGCRLQYKYQYIDKLESDVETIEAFMGTRVHESLEVFYKLVKGGRIESLDWLLNNYKDSWEKNYSPSIKIVRDEFKAEHYFENGKKALVDYYEKYTPFNQAKILSIEDRLSFRIKYKGKEYQFTGILDRLDWNDGDGTFEIHDYKTGRKLITQDEADNNWQLGLYHVALKQKWPDIENIKLIWHFLVLNKEIVSYRTTAQIDELQKSVVSKIEEIENCVDFSPRKCAVCDWCDFQNVCPLWRHPKEMEKLSVNKYLSDAGVKLVAEYKKFEEEKNELKEKISVIEDEQSKIGEAAISFAKKNNILVIDGADAQLKIDIKKETRPPTKMENEENWWELRNILIKENKFQDVSTINSNMMIYQMRKWPASLLEKINKFLIEKISESVRLIKKY